MNKSIGNSKFENGSSRIRDNNEKKKKNEVNCIFARSLGKERKVVKTAKKAGSAM